MIYLRYRNFADNRWDYDAETQTVRAHFPDGAVAIPVCTQRVPRRGAFFIHRRDEDQWVIAPARCSDTGFARLAAYDDAGRYYDFVVLSGAPLRVNDLLEQLYGRMV